MLSLFSATLIFAAAGAPQPALTCDLSSGVQRLTVDGGARDVHFHRPVDARGAPVLFYWHGWGGSAQASLPLARVLAPDMWLVVPQGLPRRFDGLGSVARDGFQIRSGEFDDRDVKLFDAVLQYLGEHGCGDTTRVMSTGFSNGGFTSNFLGCVRSDRLVAIAAVSGGGPFSAETCGGPVPAALVHGKTDRVVPFARFTQSLETREAQNRCPPPALACAAPVSTWTHDGGHIYPRTARRFVADFLRRQADAARSSTRNQSVEDADRGRGASPSMTR